MANQVSSKHKQGVQCRGKIQGDHYCVRDKNLHFFQFHEDHSHAQIDLEFKKTISGALTDLKEAVFGVEKQFDIWHVESCEAYNGTSARSKSTKRYRVCGGMGEVMRTQETDFGMFSQVRDKWSVPCQCACCRDMPRIRRDDLYSDISGARNVYWARVAQWEQLIVGAQSGRSIRADVYGPSDGFQGQHYYHSQSYAPSGDEVRRHHHHHHHHHHRQQQTQASQEPPAKDGNGLEILQGRKKLKRKVCWTQKRLNKQKESTYTKAAGQIPDNAQSVGPVPKRGPIPSSFDQFSSLEDLAMELQDKCQALLANFTDLSLTEQLCS
ncbi:hypothetical protein SELMODRAFT_423770 [Selaginella moellendorffii]|uniref:Uncharacterized protein n=1 Tax=Selaginella moellendorffii TaxID=88036 RepID=D8SMT2_SELML|nr:hypothetical protein SELMODRAFT_423770 [Selaginella moellendorffii]